MHDLMLQGAVFSVPVNIDEAEIKDYCSYWVYPYLKIMYAHPSIKYYLYISGKLLEYFDTKVKECKDVLLELIEKEQVELLGGMYYDAAPFIQAKKDQREQLGKLHNFITKTYSQRINGVWIHPGTYNSSIIPTLKQSGVRFLMVHKSYIEPEPALESIGLLEQLGNTLVAIPYTNSYRNIQLMPASQDRQTGRAKFFVVLCDSSMLLDSPQFFHELEFLQQAIEEHGFAKHTFPPSHFIKKNTYIRKEICRLRFSPWGENEGATFIHFINTRPECRLLYGRLQYITRLLETCKKNKNIDYPVMIRSLWEEQSHFSLWKPHYQWGIHHKNLRQNMYKALNSIEKTIQQGVKNKTTTLNHVDMNLDSVDEQFIKTASFNVLIEPLWASLCLLERASNIKRWNYSSCFVPHDNPKYAPWSFKDFLHESTNKFVLDIVEWHKNILNNEYNEAPIQYQFTSFSEQQTLSSYQSIQTKAKSMSTVSKSVSLDSLLLVKKQYQVRGNTLTVQYCYDNHHNIVYAADHIIEVNLSFFSDDKNVCDIIVGNKSYNADVFSYFKTNEIIIQHKYKKERLHIFFSHSTHISIAPVHEMSQRVQSTLSYQYTSFLFSTPLSLASQESMEYTVQCTFSKM